MPWKISYYDSALQKAILNLPAGLVGRYLHCTDRMQIYGPDLGMPHTRAMGSGLFELRLKSKEGISRVFFCTIVGHEILMLH
jgi:phage-related protein